MLDRDAIDRLFETVGSDPESLTEMIESFLEEGPVLVRLMAEAAAEGDFVVMRRNAHSLKSNARDFGAAALGGLCAALEEELRQGQEPADAAQRAAVIAAEWRGVESALRALAKEYSA